MHEQWQAVALRLKGERARLSATAFPMLHRSKAEVTAADASSQRVTPLLKDDAGNLVRLGVFTMPALPSDVIESPHGVCAHGRMVMMLDAQAVAHYDAHGHTSAACRAVSTAIQVSRWALSSSGSTRSSAPPSPTSSCRP